MFSLDKKQYVIAAVGAFLLVLIYQMIAHAINSGEHPLVVSITESFFVGLIIGSYFLLKTLVTVDFAALAVHLAFVLLYSASVAKFLGRAY